MQLDPALIKLKDPRVQQLLLGHGSILLLSRTLHYPDWLVVDKDRLTAIPQYQYATLVPTLMLVLSLLLLIKYLTDTEFQSQLPDLVRDKLMQIKAALDVCPVCKRLNYKKQVQLLLLPYIELKPEKNSVLATYPDTTVQFRPVFNGATVPVRLSIPRRACYDCILKHIGQASITAMLAELGYPQHIMLCYGHLALAILLCPQDAVQLKALLTLCLGISKMTGHGFVPLRVLYASVQEHRSADQGSVALTPNEQDGRYSLEHGITALLIAQMTRLDRQRLYRSIDLFVLLCAELKQLSANSDSQSYSADRGRWLGLLACIAELLSAYSVLSANAIRNIRLLFYAAPLLICDVPEYSMYDVMALLKLYVSSLPALSMQLSSSAQDCVSAAKTEL